jgi:hypothetical protein
LSIPGHTPCCFSQFESRGLAYLVAYLSDVVVAGALVTLDYKAVGFAMGVGLVAGFCLGKSENEMVAI